MRLTPVIHLILRQRIYVRNAKRLHCSKLLICQRKDIGELFSTRKLHGTGHINNDYSDSAPKDIMNKDNFVNVLSESFKMLESEEAIELDTTNNFINPPIKKRPISILLTSIVDFAKHKGRLDVSKEFSEQFTSHRINLLSGQSTALIITQLFKLGFNCKNGKEKDRNKDMFLQFINHLALQAPDKSIRIPAVLSSMATAGLRWKDISGDKSTQDGLTKHIVFWIKGSEAEECMGILRSLLFLRVSIRYLSMENRDVLLENTIARFKSRFSTVEKCEVFYILCSLGMQFSTLPDHLQQTLYGVIYHTLNKKDSVAIGSSSSGDDDMRYSEVSSQNNTNNSNNRTGNIYSSSISTNSTYDDDAFLNLFAAMELSKITFRTAPVKIQQATEYFLTATLRKCQPDTVAKLFYRIGRNDSVLFSEISPASIISLQDTLTALLGQMTEKEVPRCLLGVARMGLNFNTTTLNFNTVSENLDTQIQAILTAQLCNYDAQNLETVIATLSLLNVYVDNMTPPLRNAFSTAIRNQTDYFSALDDVRYMSVLRDLAKISVPYTELGLQLSRIDAAFVKLMRVDMTREYHHNIRMLSALGARWSTLSKSLQDTVIAQFPHRLRHPKELELFLTSFARMQLPFSALPAKIQRALWDEMERKMNDVDGVNSGSLPVKSYIKIVEAVVEMGVAFDDMPPEVQGGILARYDAFLPLLAEWECERLDITFKRLDNP